MLVVSRRAGELLLIGDVEIIVSRIGRSTVKLAIKAPRGTRIIRGELVVSSDESPEAVAGDGPSDGDDDGT